MKAVLMSIHSKWCELIFSGEKEIEVRKTAPNLETPYKVYAYETLGKRTSCRQCAIWQTCHLRSPFGCNEGAGAVVGEFVCDDVDIFVVGSFHCDSVEALSCLSHEEMIDYFYKPEELDGRTIKLGKALHITEPKRYDTPKELSEFTPWCEKSRDIEDNLEMCCDCPKAVFDEDGAWYGCRVTRAPQSWCYVEEVVE